MSVTTRNGNRLQFLTRSLWLRFAVGVIGIFLAACSDDSSTPAKDSNTSRGVWVEPDDTGKTVLGAVEDARYSVDISIGNLA